MNREDVAIDVTIQDKHPEQAGGDERAAFELFVRKHCGMPEHIAVNWDAKFTNDAWEGWQARAALAQRSEFHRHLKECADEVATWPSYKREALTQLSPKCVKCGGTGEADSGGVHPWGEPVLIPCDCETEQAEAERPEAAEVAFVLRNIGAMDAEDIDGDNVDLRFEDAEGRDTGCDVSIVEYAEKAADLFEQHDRIVGELRADRDSWAEQAEQRLADWDEMRKERDAALARVAELERQEPVALANRGLHAFWVKWTEAAAGLYGPGIKLYAAPVAQAQQLNDLDKQCRDDVARALGLRPNQERGFAWSYLLASIKSCVKASGDSAQAQHSVPEGWMLVECGIWTQEQVDEMQKTVTRFRNSEFVDDRALAMAVADAGQCKAPEISLAELLAAAPGKEVGHE